MIEEELGVFKSEMYRLLVSLEANAAGSADALDQIRKANRALTKIEKDGITKDEDIREMLWDDFESFLESLDPTSDIKKKVVDKWEVPIVWGFWLWLHEDIPINLGYSDKHVEMKQGPTNPSGRHVYKDRPKRVTWAVQPVKESGEVKFFTAIAKINEVDAVSSVPAISEEIDILSTSQRVINPKLRSDQWQRGLDPSRIVSISSFLDSSRNSFSNSVMLYAPNSKHIEWEENMRGDPIRVHIDFQFLVTDPVRRAPFLTDHKGKKDLRPLSIIDGQHRIRGGMRSPRGHQLEVPVILFPKALGNRGAAKYFAEINTLNEPLDVLHELFMRHKFGLASTKKERTYAKYDGTAATNRDRANRLAYECAAHVNLDWITNEKGDIVEEGALFKLIRMLAENTTEKNYVIAADMWVKHSYQWFMPNGPHPPPDSKSEDPSAFFDQVKNYLNAFMDVCNEGDWKDKEARWLKWTELHANDSKGKRPYIQYNTSIRSILTIYPKVEKIVRDSGYSNTVITRERFKQSLRVLGNIDWLDGRVKKHYVGTGEYPWKSLTRWMIDALDRGEEDPYPVDVVMSETTPSERGKGLLSKVEDGGIEYAYPNLKWPHPNEELELIASRPINARRGCSVRLKNPGGGNVHTMAGIKIQHSAKPDTFEIKVSYWDGIDNLDHLVLYCEWGNAVDRVVSTSIKLEPPA